LQTRWYLYYIILTNLRVVYFNEKHLGRYAFKSIKSEDGTVILLEKVDHDDLVGFIDALENAYNSIAVEPISIKHERDLLGKATWEFNKPAEIIVRQQPSDQPKPSDDSLDQLRMRFIRGEISEEEVQG
jgi:hypothetical protein